MTFSEFKAGLGERNLRYVTYLHFETPERAYVTELGEVFGVTFGRLRDTRLGVKIILYRSKSEDDEIALELRADADDGLADILAALETQSERRGWAAPWPRRVAD